MQKAVPISLIWKNNCQAQIRTNRGTRTKPFQAEHFKLKVMSQTIQHLKRNPVKISLDLEEIKLL